MYKTLSLKCEIHLLLPHDSSLQWLPASPTLAVMHTRNICPTQRQYALRNAIYITPQTNITTLPRMSSLLTHLPTITAIDGMILAWSSAKYLHEDNWRGNSTVAAKVNGLSQRRQCITVLQTPSGATQIPKTTVIIPTTASQMTTQLLLLFGLPNSLAPEPHQPQTGKSTHSGILSILSTHPAQIFNRSLTLVVSNNAYFSDSDNGSTLANHHGNCAGLVGHSPYTRSVRACIHGAEAARMRRTNAVQRAMRSCVERVASGLASASSPSPSASASASGVLAVSAISRASSSAKGISSTRSTLPTR